jgi:predicted molibdopterin-dependent oxidoreductase YjgC
VDEAIAGELDALWVFGHDLLEVFGADKARELALNARLLIYSGTNDNPTVSLAHWALPSAAAVEKDGTFVNCDGRVQRIGRAFDPLGDSRADWRFLLDLAGRTGMDRAGDWSSPADVFAALADSVGAFAGMSHESISEQGALTTSAQPLAGAGKP